MALSNLSIYYTWKEYKSVAQKENLKYLEQHGMNSFNCLMDLIPYYTFKYIIKKHAILTDKSLVKIYVNKIHNEVTFKIKSGHYLEL